MQLAQVGKGNNNSINSSTARSKIHFIWPFVAGLKGHFYKRDLEIKGTAMKNNFKFFHLAEKPKLNPHYLQTSLSGTLTKWCCDSSSIIKLTHIVLFKQKIDTIKTSIFIKNRSFSEYVALDELHTFF